VFAISAKWFDNGLIVRRLANEETSAGCAIVGVEEPDDLER
jgi:hypothetical protein